MNYPWFCNDLNVLRVCDLSEEILHVYDGDPSYGFCSIDAVKMFDNIPMGEVYKIIYQLGTRFCAGMVNAKSLVGLMKLDCEFPDYLKFKSPRRGVKETQYFHQRKGISMGGNTSTAYADLYMSYALAKAKGSFDSLGVKLMRKYVDDFLFYLPKANYDALLVLMERITCLKYTIEVPKDGRHIT